MNTTPTFTLAQINPTVGDLVGNTSLILKTWQSSTNDIVVFPECALCGYPPEDLVLRPDFISEVEKQIAILCDQTKSLTSTAIIPTPWVDDGALYNAALVIRHGHIVHKSYKYHLPDYGVFDDSRIFTKGPIPAPFIHNGHSIGILVCEDMWFPDVAAQLKDQGAQTLLSLNASPYDTNKSISRLKHAQNRVKETGLPFIYVNQVGGQDELVFDGGSFVLDAHGAITYQAPFFETYVGRSNGDKPITNIQSEDPSSNLYKAVALGLKDYVTKNGFPGVILGLSGGIDSALTAAIAVDALGADKVHCVMMPSPFTSKASLDDAKACAAMLGVQYDIIAIEPMMQAFKMQVPDLTGIAHENIQSRIRGTTLMAISNISGFMVVSTGNKSEMAVGYATLYGDMNGGFNPLKDLYKTQVYNLSRWRNDQSPVMPNTIITKAPTAELRDNQTDQDSLPPYDILDGILKGLIEDDSGLETLTGQGFDKETILKVWRLLDRAEYKRRQSCPGVKVTSRAFGRDRRYPITNGFLSSFDKNSV